MAAYTPEAEKHFDLDAKTEEFLQMMAGLHEVCQSLVATLDDLTRQLKQRPCATLKKEKLVKDLEEESMKLTRRMRKALLLIASEKEPVAGKPV